MVSRSSRRALVAFAAVAIAACAHPLPGAFSPSAAPHGRGHGAVFSLHMIDDKRGWASGLSTVGMTADGADTIKDVTPAGLGLDEPITWFDALGASESSIVVSRPTGKPAALYRTRDAGAHWTRLPLPQAGRLHFLDWAHGWLLSETQRADHSAEDVVLWRTTDGGGSWTTVYQTTQRLSIQPGFQQGDCMWVDFTFISADAGFVGLSCPTSAPPRLDVTGDGGVTWQRVTLPELPVSGGYRTAGWVQAPVFASPTRGATLVGECVGDGNQCAFYGAIERTNDGGKTWTPGAVVHGGPAVEFQPDAVHAWLPYGCLRACTGDSTLLTTNDAGISWTELPLDSRLSPNMHVTRTFQLVSSTLGFATAVTSDGTGFYRSSDGGRTFDRLRAALIR